MIKSFVNLFLISSVCVGIFFLIVTTFSKKGKNKTIIYLNLLILSLTLNYTQIVILDNFFSDANYFFKTLRLPFYAFILPAFYTFVTYYLNIEKKIKSFVQFSLILFFIEVLCRIVLYNQFYNNYQVVSKYRQIEEIINILFSIFLFIKAFLLLFNGTKLYEKILTYDNIKWLKRFMFLASIIMVSWTIAFFININRIYPLEYVYYPLRISISILIFWLGYQGFFNYSLLNERIQVRKLIDESIKSSKTKNPSSTSNNKILNIKNHIENNFSYLNPQYSLENLSEELKMSTSSLSKIINTESEYNFSDYINFLRIEKSKELLLSDDYKNYTILSIGLECGFNSKSTFYLAFKKFTNTTPVEYRTKKI
jgi:AraC-like DNA-binding protein